MKCPWATRPRITAAAGELVTSADTRNRLTSMDRLPGAVRAMLSVMLPHTPLHLRCGMMCCTIYGMTPTTVRKSIPLTTEDQAHLDRLRTPGTPEHEALSEISGVPIPENASEAETLHALLAAGKAAVIERVMLTGYAALAAAEDDEDRSARRAMRERAARLGD